MARSPGELRLVRASTLGLSDVSDGFLGALGSVSVRATTSFPATDVTLSLAPGQAAPTAQAQGSGVSRWVLAHVVRPREEITIGGTTVTIDRYKDEADYSQAARILAWLFGAGTVGGSLWILVRAFYPTRRSNRRVR